MKKLLMPVVILLGSASFATAQTSAATAHTAKLHLVVNNEAAKTETNSAAGIAHKQAILDAAQKNASASAARTPITSEQVRAAKLKTNATAVQNR